MTLAYVLALVAAAAPRAPAHRAEAIADAIATVAASEGDAAWLVTTALHENSMRGRGVPFGWMRYRRGMSLAAAAEGALRVKRLAAATCGHRARAEVAFGFYISGKCRVVGNARARARTLRRLSRL